MCVQKWKWRLDWNCRRGHWRRTSYGWTLQGWTLHGWTLQGGHRRGEHRRGGHCRGGHCRVDIARVDIAGVVKEATTFCELATLSIMYWGAESNEFNELKSRVSLNSWTRQTVQHVLHGPTSFCLHSICLERRTEIHAIHARRCTPCFLSRLLGA